MTACFASDHRENHRPRSVRRCAAGPVVSRRTALNYKRADFDGLRRSLSVIPWGLIDDVGVDKAVDRFYALLESDIAGHVPTVILRRRLPPWFDGAVRTALRLKEAAFRRLRRNPGRRHRPTSQTRDVCLKLCVARNTLNTCGNSPTILKLTRNATGRF